MANSAGEVFSEEVIILEEDEPEIGAGAGGHAGGSSISIEERNRAGIHYMISRSGATHHGKEYAPQEVKPGSVHVTAYPGGYYKVNEGTMRPEHERHLMRALSVTKLHEVY